MTAAVTRARRRQISSGHAVTAITVAHAAPEGDVRVALALGEAPAPADTMRTLPGLGRAVPITDDTFAASESGWALLGAGTAPGTGGRRAACGAFGPLLGGPGVLGPGSAAERRVDIPRRHTAVRVDFAFAKIDAWAGSAAALFVDGALAWRRAFPCPVRRAAGECATPYRAAAGGGVVLDPQWGPAGLAAAAEAAAAAGGGGGGGPAAGWEGSLECGDGTWPDALVNVSVTLPHTAATLALRFETDLPGGAAGGGGLAAAAQPGDRLFARDKSWGLARVAVAAVDDLARAGAWAEGPAAPPLYNASAAAIPPADVADTCTPAAPAAGPGCGPLLGGRRACVGGGACSRREYRFRLAAAGEYVVGVYGANFSAADASGGGGGGGGGPLLPFVLEAAVHAAAPQDAAAEVSAAAAAAAAVQADAGPLAGRSGGSVGPVVLPAGRRRAEPLPLIQVVSPPTHTHKYATATATAAATDTAAAADTAAAPFSSPNGRHAPPLRQCMSRPGTTRPEPALPYAPPGAVRPAVSERPASGPC